MGSVAGEGSLDLKSGMKSQQVKPRAEKATAHNTYLLGLRIENTRWHLRSQRQALALLGKKSGANQNGKSLA